MSESREPKVQSILHTYLQACDRGESPDRQAILDAHPDLREELAEYFADASKLEALAKSLKTATYGQPIRGGLTAPSSEALAKQFPQFEILELLGQGGMGAVYKAKQTALDRVVALKILPTQLGDDSAFVERFLREAKALAKLNHPNIVAVYDVGQTEGLENSGADAPRAPICFFVMEYIDGVNLRQAMRAGNMSPREALAIVPQICEALQYAHDEGIVHRDIKPENVLLDKKGRVKIADFGLAKILVSGGRESPDSLTGTHQVMGTLRYMAPEQMEGAKEVDHRADIYSLGVVFYELLTGEVPMGRFAPPSKKVHIDVRLDEVVLRALEREPEQRWQQASEVKTEVETIRSSTPNTPPIADAESPSKSVDERGLASAANDVEKGRAEPSARIPSRATSAFVLWSLLCTLIFLVLWFPSFASPGKEWPPFIGILDRAYWNYEGVSESRITLEPRQPIYERIEIREHAVVSRKGFQDSIVHVGGNFRQDLNELTYTLELFPLRGQRRTLTWHVRADRWENPTGIERDGTGFTSSVVQQWLYQAHKGTDVPEVDKVIDAHARALVEIVQRASTREPTTLRDRGHTRSDSSRYGYVSGIAIFKSGLDFAASTFTEKWKLREELSPFRDWEAFPEQTTWSSDSILRVGVPVMLGIWVCGLLGIWHLSHKRHDNASLWSRLPAFVRLAVRSTLVVGYLLCLITFFGFTQTTSTFPAEPGRVEYHYAVGLISPWLEIHYQPAFFENKVNFMAASMGVALGGLCLLTVLRKLERLDRGKVHSIWWHYGIWTILFALVIGMGFRFRREHEPRTAPPAKKVEAPANPKDAGGKR